MNQINPLHIGALLVTFILFLFLQVSSLKGELQEADSEYKESEKLAVTLNSLKAVYSVSDKREKSLNRLLSTPSIKEANLKIKRDAKSVQISSQSLETKVLNTFMGKVLNDSYKVTSLKIKRLSDTRASLIMEIQL